MTTCPLCNNKGMNALTASKGCPLCDRRTSSLPSDVPRPRPKGKGKPVSSCCKAPVKPAYEDKGWTETNYMICQKCFQPCDILNTAAGAGHRTSPHGGMLPNTKNKAEPSFSRPIIASSILGRVVPSSQKPSEWIKKRAD